MVIQMVKDTIKTGFEPAYVLAYSWFMSDIFVSEIQKIKIRYAKKLHVIGLMKTNRRIIINGKSKKANLVLDHKQKDIRFCKKHKCNYLAIKIAYKVNKVKVFWVKTKGSETWKMVINTDTDITFTNAMKYYQNLNKY
jgi:hypothetical protein